ncbi:MAG: TonB-dependent receptor [Saprospiraceae bacterium]|nr:TonB-dependent receptor [Saprospiraceae bacterium]
MKELIVGVSLLFFLCGGSYLVAQKTTISGEVMDSNTDAPLAYATVSLLSQVDSSLVTGGITFEDGRFSLDADPGVYVVKAGFVGFQAQYIGPIEVNGSQKEINAGRFSLAVDAEVLDEIVVSTERSQTEMALDKRVFNVGKDLASAGNSAVDILDNVPSVAVDVEGNVTLRGSSGVRILIDGKPSGLIGVGGTDGLRSLPADLIEKVEVITNPSARYEAEGTAGVINIVLKKDRRSGLNGSFDLSTGVPDNHGLTFNVNYRQNNFNFFGNVGGRLRTSPGVGSVIQEFLRNDSLFIYEQERASDRRSWSLSSRAGAEYFFNENTTLTGSFQYRYSESDNFTDLTYRDYVGSRENLEQISVRVDNEIETDPTLEYSLTFRKEFQGKDHDLVADLRWQDNSEREQSDLVEAFYSPDFETLPDLDDLVQRSDNQEGERQLITQLDYRKPIGNEGLFEVGYRGSFRLIQTDYLVEEIANGAWFSLDGLSNNFNYEEDVLAAYSTVGDKYGNFSFQAGLRAEYSLIVTELEQTLERNERDYLNLFPSVFLNYEFSGENQVQLSYSRRIRRPRFRSLNPFFSFSDNRNFRSGNPNLNPEFTNSFEVSHLKFWEKGSLTSAVYYRETDGVTENIREVFDDGTSVSFPVNLSTERAVGIEFTYAYNPWEWMRLNGNANFFRSKTKGNYQGQDFSADATSFFTRLTSRVELNKKTDFQLRGNYSAPRARPQGRTKSLYSIDLAFSREIMNDHGMITLNVRDLLNSRKRRYITEGENFYAEGEFQWRARTITLAFNYRLNASDRQRNRGSRRGGEEGGLNDEGY